MNFKRLTNIKGLNIWLLASAIGINLFFSFALLLLNFLLVSGGQASSSELLPLGLMLASFLVPFLVAWLVTVMAGDGRGPTYGFYGAIGAAVPMVIIAMGAGTIGILMMCVALLGGINGGLIGEAIRHRGEKRP
jgi:hypothetical protein